MQVLDSAGEFGWQLERAGLSGDGLGVPMRGDSGSPFISFDPGWQVRKAPGLREPPTSAGTLQEKQRKCRNYLNLSTRRKHTNHSSCTGEKKTVKSDKFVGNVRVTPIQHFLPLLAHNRFQLHTHNSPTLLSLLLGGISGVLEWAGPLLWGLQRPQTPWSPAPVEGVLHSYSPC